MHISQRNLSQAARAAIFFLLPAIAAAATFGRSGAPSITSQPASLTVTAGQTATFSVKTTGKNPMRCQWYKNGTAIGGAKSSTYTTPATTVSYNGATYTVVVSNGLGSVTSAGATLTVNPAATAVLSSSSTSLAFGSVTVSTTATGSVTVQNTGSAAVTIASVSVSGAGFGASGISAGSILSAGQSVVVDATFDPASSGGASGSITIGSNATNSPLVISLAGTGVAQTAYSVSLNWSPSGSATTGYNVYSSTVSGGPYTKLTAAPVDATTYSDAGVQSGQTYYFVVTAVSSDNVESAYSEQASATIP